MIRHYVIYDPASGAIIAKLLMEESLAENYSNIVAIDSEEYDAMPEINKKVDWNTKTLVDK